MEGLAPESHISIADSPEVSNLKPEGVPAVQTGSLLPQNNFRNELLYRTTFLIELKGSSRAGHCNYTRILKFGDERIEPFRPRHSVIVDKSDDFTDGSQNPAIS